MGAWLSFARRTTSRSSCCRKARHKPKKSRGHRCPIPASGDRTPVTRPMPGDRVRDRRYLESTDARLVCGAEGSHAMKVLSQVQVSRWRRDGFLSPFALLDAEE